MKNPLFHGYNCFSSAVGQHLVNLALHDALETVTMRWTFDFNQYWLKENYWCAAACIEPSDYLLQYDLGIIEGIQINTFRADFNESQEVMQEELARCHSHIVQLDFYYLTSIDWNKMEKFGYFPQHLPHYICITAVEEDGIRYQDPMYHYCGKIKAEDLEYARTRRVCEMDLYRTYYIFRQSVNYHKHTLKEKAEYQLKRYLEHEQFEMIEKFSAALRLNDKEFRDSDKFDWAFNCYLSLDSVCLQRQAFLKTIQTELPQAREAMLPLIDNWIKVKKSFHRVYREKKIVVQKDIIPDLDCLLQQEQQTARWLLERL